MLHCLAGILTPDRGEVRFGGQRVDTLKEAERSGLRRDKFGFVFQFGQLVPELTAEENAALPLLLAGTRRAAALTRSAPVVRPASPGRAWKAAGRVSCLAARPSASRWPGG